MLPNHVPSVARAVGRESGRKSRPYFRARKHSTRGRHSQWNAFLLVLLLWPKSGRKSRPSFPSDFQASRAWNQVSTQRMANATLGMIVRFHKYDLVHTLGSGPNATHTMHRFAKKTQHARGLTILSPWLRGGTHHGDFADGLCHCPSKMRAATLYLKRPTPLNRIYHHHCDFAENKCTR